MLILILSMQWEIAESLELLQTKMRELPSILFQHFVKKKRQKFRTIGDFSFIKSVEHINYLPYTINKTNIPYETINVLECH